MKQKKKRTSQPHNTKAIYLNEKKQRSNPRVISNLKGLPTIQRSDCQENKHYLTFFEKKKSCLRLPPLNIADATLSD